MVYEHKILDTFKPFRSGVLKSDDYTASQLNEVSAQGWELVSAISEFKFVLRRSITEQNG